MIIYIIMVVISLLFTYLSTKTENKIIKKFLYLLAIVPIIIVPAIRYDVGTDYNYRYVSDFNKMAKGIEITNLEVGFKLIIQVCLFLSRNSQLLFIITSTVIGFLVMNSIQINSKNVYISIIIFFIGGFFFQSLNLVRQFITMAIVFYCYRYLFERKKYKFFLLGILISFFIHSSSIFMVILLFLKNKIYAKPIIVIPIIAIILMFGTNLMNLIAPILQNTRYNVYLVGLFAKGDQSYLGIVINGFIFICLYLLYKVKEKNNILGKEDKLLINIQGLAFIMISMSSVHILFSRIAYFLYIFQILSIPYFVETSKIKEIHLGEKWTKRMLYLIFIICFISSFVYTNILNNDNEPLPYKTIFNKEKEYN